eukprot:CAMPEP_0171075620 /NCGR_PEP_ID=MMETSP0766_2-20121228/12890_1 /TAXON_ID=439317 /ORGANISM="Gambierdiscus australes, Strain CAWD 149" /LENGTH=344 /DNA_ID=CAMNT_0011532507 /DNA_START=55 /DNA_END=1089 /DNA_ORIENTATION=+
MSRAFGLAAALALHVGLCLDDATALLQQAAWAVAEPPGAEDHGTSPTVIYQAGEDVQFWDASSGSGQWVNSRVIGEGGLSDTYDILVTSSPEAFQDFRDVPAHDLRRLPSFAYEVGELLEVMAKNVSGAATMWVPCTITSRGPAQDMYSIRVAATLADRNVSGVPGSHLRRFEPEKYKEVQEHFGKMKDPLQAFAQMIEAMTHDVPSAGLDKEILQAAQFEKAAKAYANGERAEVQIMNGPLNGTWVPCIIMGKASVEHAYNIRVGGQEYDNVYIVALRKAPTAPGQFAVGEEVEVRATSGLQTGSWVKVKISGKGEKPNTYHISVGQAEIRDLPAAAFRKIGS